jgi:hypothetical protein
MTSKATKYKRCRRCKELVLDPVNCANCASRDPLSLTTRTDHGRRRVPVSSIDSQEGNAEEALGGVNMKVKSHRL